MLRYGAQKLTIPVWSSELSTAPNLQLNPSATTYLLNRQVYEKNNA